MRVLKTEELRELLGVNATGVMGPRDQAAIASAALWGVTASELAQIEVGHVVGQNGRLKQKWGLPAKIAFNGYARILFTEHPRLIQLLDKYLNWRVKRGWGIRQHSKFRGLDPASKLLLNDKAQPFHFTGTKTGGRRQPTGLNLFFKRLIGKTELADEGVTYGAFRKSFMAQLAQTGLSVRNIMAVTGIRDYESVSRVVKSNPLTVEKAVTGLYDKL